MGCNSNLALSSMQAHMKDGCQSGLDKTLNPENTGSNTLSTNHSDMADVNWFRKFGGFVKMVDPQNLGVPLLGHLHLLQAGICLRFNAPFPYRQKPMGVAVTVHELVDLISSGGHFDPRTFETDIRHFIAIYTACCC